MFVGTWTVYLFIFKPIFLNTSAKISQISKKKVYLELSFPGLFYTLENGIFTIIAVTRGLLSLRTAALIFCQSNDFTKNPGDCCNNLNS